LLIAVPAVLAALALISLWLILWSPNSFDGDGVVTVSGGDSFRQIEDSLVAEGIVGNRLFFDLAVKLTGAEGKMMIGRYKFPSGISNSELLEDLETGRSIVLIPLIVPEGIRARRFARLCRRELGLDSARLASLVSDSTFIRSLGVEAGSLEGYLMPDTYLFNWQEGEETVLRTLVASFFTFFTDSLAARAGKLGMSVHDVVTLASIVEAETSVDTERATIAGVYVNRLRKRMRLEADPTIQYIIPDGPRRLTYADLKTRSPYNTYRNYGLPPGPINSPGRAAIMATLDPEKHGYYFFVANGDGGHTFSRLYSEHLKAVRRFQRKRDEATRNGG
jgi:UPF0755 protein